MKGSSWGTIILLVLAYVFFKSCLGCGGDSSNSSYSSLKGYGEYIVTCSSCGKKFRSTDPNPKWCPDCTDEEKIKKFNRDVQEGKYPNLR